MDVLTMSAMVLISVIHIRVCSFSFSTASDLRRSLFKPHSDFSNASNVLCRPKSVTLTTRNLRWPEIRHLRFACAVHFTSLEPLLALQVFRWQHSDAWNECGVASAQGLERVGKFS